MELSLRQRSSSHRITQSGFRFAGSAMMPATRMENLSVHSPEILPVLCLKALVRHLLRGALPKQLLRTRSGGVASALPLVSQDITDTYQYRECFATLNEKSPRTDRFRADRFISPKERQLHKARDLYCAAERVLLECSSRALLNTVKAAPLHPNLQANPLAVELACVERRCSSEPQVVLLHERSTNPEPERPLVLAADEPAGG